MQQIEIDFNEILNNIIKTQEEINKWYGLQYKLLEQKKQFITNLYKYKFYAGIQPGIYGKYDYINVINDNIKKYKIGSLCFWFDNFYYTNNILDVIAMYSDIGNLLIEFFDVDNTYKSVVFGVDTECSNVSIISKSRDSKKPIPMDLFNKLITHSDRYKIFDLLITDEFELGLTLIKNL
jgi:hypothetical protein